MSTSQIRIAIVGCGRVVERFHLPALRELGSLAVVAAADPSAERRQWIESQLPGIKTFPSGDELIHDAQLEAALIAVPPGEQAQLALSALEAGLHVLVEKPGGASKGEAERLAEAANRSHRLLMVGLNRRFMPNYRQLRERFRAQPIAPRFRGAYFLEVDRRAWAPVGGVEDLDSATALLLDLVPHQLDALRWLIPDEIVAVHRLANELVPGGRELRFEVEFHSGGRIECRARHGRSYDERFWLDGRAGAHALYPTGTASGRLAAAPLRDSALAFLTWLDRKRIRLGYKPDVMAGSFRDQLKAFVAEIRGERGDDGACGPQDLVALHKWLAAIAAEGKPGTEPAGAAQPTSG